jgi:prepilin-type N-terminal cleavage/methylation domain-containing protein
MIVPESISINVSRSQRAFTLVEMLAVIAVMLLMLKLTLPSLDGLLGAEAKGMTRTEFIGNLNRARSIALETGVPVYVVFFPKYSDLTVVGSSDPAGTKEAYFQKTDSLNQLLGLQLNGYALYQARQPGNLPHMPRSRWISDWKMLPEGHYFAEEMLAMLPDSVAVSRLKNGEPQIEVDFVVNQNIPLPVGIKKAQGKMVLPALKYNARGELENAGVKGCYLFVSRGGVFPPEMKKGKFLPEDAEPPAFEDVPDFDRLWLVVNGITGRAAVEELTDEDVTKGARSVDRISNINGGKYDIFIRSTQEKIIANLGGYSPRSLKGFNQYWPGRGVSVKVVAGTGQGNIYRLVWEGDPVPAFSAVPAASVAEVSSQIRKLDPSVGLEIQRQIRRR